MKYLLDTNIIAYWLNGNREIEEKICEIGLGSVCISFITLCELYYGAYKSVKKEKNLNNINLLLSKVSVIHSKNSIAENFGILKDKCVRTGNIIDGADLLLASFALDYNMIFVTNNIKHFKNIKNLEIENWVR